MDNTPKPSFWKHAWFVFKWLEVRLRFVAILLVTALVVGYWDNIQNHIEKFQRHRHMAVSGQGGVAELKAAVEYFCPMHQFVIRNQPGKCPICGMDLSRRAKGAPVELPAGVQARVQASPERILQAGVAVEPVAWRLLIRTVRAYGTIETDETHLARITARFPGRIEDLLVNAVGVTVKTGEPLVRIYSPKFLAATQEYLQTLTALHQVQADPKAAEDDRQRAAKIAEFARDRLALAGFTKDQLDAMTKTGKADQDVTLNSPLAGTVLEKNVLAGQMVEEGTVLYTIADLFSLWVQAQVLESDLAAVKVGMPVEVTAAAYPGRIFYGNVNFIAPVLNTDTRSVKVRVVVDNTVGDLKPGMAVNAVFRTPVGQWNAVTETTAAKTPAAEASSGKPVADVYTCPMHPEVISDKPGDCPKCGMHLVKKAPEKAADDSDQQWATGYTCAMHPQEMQDKPGVCTTCGCGMKLEKTRIEKVLAVPESAVIDTGTRQIVYVESESGVFDARIVTLGPRCDAWYPILAGLQHGDRVVTRGSFLIDAEARLNPVAAPVPALPAAPAVSSEQERK